MKERQSNLKFLTRSGRSGPGSSSANAEERQTSRFIIAEPARAILLVRKGSKITIHDSGRAADMTLEGLNKWVPFPLSTPE